jgi:hypothetical protein
MFFQIEAHLCAIQYQDAHLVSKNLSIGIEITHIPIENAVPLGRQVLGLYLDRLGRCGGAAPFAGGSDTAT